MIVPIPKLHLARALDGESRLKTENRHVPLLGEAQPILTGFR